VPIKSSSVVQRRAASTAAKRGGNKKQRRPNSSAAKKRSGKKVTADSLNDDLEKYMMKDAAFAKTKLDNDLDEYMKDATK